MSQPTPGTVDPPTQLTLPGMAGSCPHCGSRGVEPEETGSALIDAEAWHCRNCGRVWWQLALPFEASRAAITRGGAR